MTGQGRAAHRICRVLDIGLAVAFALMLAEHLRARSIYAIVPFEWAGLAVALVALVPPYRQRTGDRVRNLWRQADSFAREGGVGSLPWGAAVGFVVVPVWLVYLLNQTTLGATDTRPVIPTAVSLLEERNSNLDEYFRPDARPSLLDRDGRIRDCFRIGFGGIYSSYPAGMVPFALVAVGISRAEGTELHNLPVHRRLEKIAAAGLAAVTLGLVFLLLLHLGTARAALVTTGLLAVGSGFFSTVGMALWQHGGTLFWSTLILLGEFRDPGSRRWAGVVARGFCAGMMVTCRLTAISFLIPYGVWLALRSPLRAVVLVLVALLTFAPWSWFYQTTYGTRFGPSTSFLVGGLWNFGSIDPFLGVLVCPARGLLVYQPWVVLAFLPVALRARSGPPGWRSFCGSAIVAHVGLIAAWGSWWGGWCWGSRLLCDVLVLLGMLCVGPVETLLKTRRGTALVVALAVVSTVMQALGVFCDTQHWNGHVDLPAGLWSWRNAPFMEPFRQWWR